MAVGNTQAYYDTATITTVKSFIVPKTQFALDYIAMNSDFKNVRILICAKITKIN